MSLKIRHVVKVRERDNQGYAKEANQQRVDRLYRRTNLEYIWWSEVRWQSLVSSCAFICLHGSFVIYSLGARNLREK